MKSKKKQKFYYLEDEKSSRGEDPLKLALLSLLVAIIMSLIVFVEKYD